MFKSLVLGVLLMWAGAASAQTIVDGSNVDEILNLAREHGSADLTKQDNGNPKITGKIKGVVYHILFQNCTDNRDCEDVQFYAGFLDNNPTLEVINAWNAEKRFGRAYLDQDSDASVEFDVNLQYGVTRKNLNAAFLVWALILDRYTTHIGYK